MRHRTLEVPLLSAEVSWPRQQVEPLVELADHDPEEAFVLAFLPDNYPAFRNLA